ncbi:malonic semialdehyde reductase [Paenarthrobacter sp. NPDC089714]|uniref:malonic semialdehyde reductase n=1 Tax=Paenarthrobacter sp. NPDC089714 TaxID=3364377 RepID=UPI0037FF15C4
MTLALDRQGQDLLFLKARSVRSFSNEQVTDEQMRAIYDLVKFGPTAFNLSPLRITLVRSKQGRSRLLSHLSAGNRRKAQSAPVTAILSTDLEFHEELPRLAPHAVDVGSHLFASRQRREDSARLNGALQAGYFLIGVRAAGLAALPMTGYDSAGLAADFLDRDHLPLMVVSIGLPGPDPEHPRSPRLDYEEVVTIA